MKVLYFLRNHRAGISINRVSKTVSRLNKDKEELYLPDSNPTFKAIIKNIFFVCRHRDKAAIHQIVGGEHYAVLGLYKLGNNLEITQSYEHQIEIDTFEKRNDAWNLLPNEHSGALITC